LILIDLLIPFVIEGFCCFLKLRLESGFNGTCLLRSLFSLLCNVENDLFMSALLQIVPNKSLSDSSRRNFVSGQFEKSRLDLT